MSDWFSDLDAARALGLAYATMSIEAGQAGPAESPLSGEWAGDPLPRDVWVALGGTPESFEEAEDWEVSDVCDHWEDGYNSAPWPEVDHE